MGTYNYPYMDKMTRNLTKYQSNGLVKGKLAYHLTHQKWCVILKTSRTSDNVTVNFNNNKVVPVVVKRDKLYKGWYQV